MDMARVATDWRVRGVREGGVWHWRNVEQMCWMLPRLRRVRGWSMLDAFHFERESVANKVRSVSVS